MPTVVATSVAQKVANRPRAFVQTRPGIIPSTLLYRWPVARAMLV
jgi:hypothetical protein